MTGTEAVVRAGPDFDPTRPEVQRDPYPWYRRLRDEAPVCHIPALNAWGLFRYDDCKHTFLHPEDYSARDFIAQAFGDLDPVPETPSLIALDPPAHTPLRKLTATAFVPSVTRRMEPKVRAIVDGLLDEIEDRGSVPLLRRVVLHSDLRVRTAALRALVHMDRALPESTIRAVLDSADPSFVERTLLLLGRAELPTAVEPIGDLLRKGSSASRGVRLRALEALGLLGDARSLEVIRPLLGGLRLTNLEERRAAYRALAGLPREVGEPLLKKGLRARDAEIQATCEQALATHGSAPTEPKR